MLAYEQASTENGSNHLTHPLPATNNWLPTRFRRFGRELLWIGIGQGAVAVGSLMGLSFLTRALSPEAYGELALALTVASLAQQVAMGPLSGAFMRFYAAASEAKQLSAYLRASKRLMSIASLAMLVVAGAMVVGFVTARQTKWVALLGAAFLFSLVSGYNTAMDAMQNAARERPVVALHQGANQWLRFMVALGLILLLGPSSSAAMLGFFVASVAVMVSQRIFLRRIVPPRLAATPPSGNDVARWTRQISQYTWPFALWGMFTWAQASADRWALQVFGQPRDVGLYAALYQLGYSPMVLLSNFMMQLVSPVLFSSAGDCTDQVRVARSDRLHVYLMTASALTAGALVVVALLVHSQVLSLFVASQYRSVSSLLPLMIAASGLFSLGQAASLSLLTSLDSKALLAPKIITALLGVFLSFVGAFSFGIRGVVYASVATSLFFLAWVMILVGRKRRASPAPVSFIQRTAQVPDL